MDCINAYRYLFQYAMNKLPDDIKAGVAAHLETCSSCRDIVTALQNLLPHLPAGREGEITHYNIDFPSIGIFYSNLGSSVENSEYLNEILNMNNGCLPDDIRFWGVGFSKENPILAMFDNEGDEMGYVIYEDEGNPDIYRFDIRKVKKIYDPIHWEHAVGKFEAKQLSESSDLHTGKYQNAFGNDVNDGVYIAIPSNASNVRIKRGNGVIDCGTYKFVYSQRYIIDSETLWLEYSYNL